MKSVNILKQIILIGLFLFSASLTMKIATQNITVYFLILLPYIVLIITSKKSPYIPKQLKIFYLLYGTSILISIIFGTNTFISIKNIHSHLKFILLIPLINIFITRKKSLNHLIITIIIFITIQNIYCIISGYIHNLIWLRLTGFLGHWMTYAGVLIFTSFYSLYLIIINSNKIIKSLYLLVFLINIFALILTQTRSAVFAVLIGLLFVLYNYIKIDKKLTFIFLSLLILFIIIIIKIPVLNKRFTTITDFSNYKNNFNSRLTYWSGGLDVIKKYIVTGTGTGNTEKIFQKHNEYYIFLPGHVHNNYVQITIELGFLGLISIIYFLFSNFVQAYKNFNKSHHFIFLIIAGTILAFSISGLAEYNWGDSELTMNLIYLISIGYANNYLLYKNDRTIS